jgi:polyhydroxybutyrate depolymerase
MRRSWAVKQAWIVAGLVASAFLSAASASADAIEVDGVERSFILNVPDGAPTPAPTVIVLHGGGGNARQVQEHTDFDVLSEREGVVTVYPDGVDNQWNDAREESGDVSISAADDVAFLRALIGHLIGNGVADPDRIYMTGISNGGFMTLRMACEAPELLAGAAIVAANLPDPPACAPLRPTPIVFFHGTDDAWVPYAGGEVAPRARGYRGRAISATETVDIWRDINGCDASPSSVPLPDRAPRDGLRSHALTFDGCAAPLEQIIVEGGGHTWPGTQQRRPLVARMVGPATQDFDANEAMWRFWTTGSVLD